MKREGSTVATVLFSNIGLGKGIMVLCLSSQILDLYSKVVYIIFQEQRVSQKNVQIVPIGMKIVPIN